MSFLLLAGIQCKLNIKHAFRFIPYPCKYTNIMSNTIVSFVGV